MRRFSVSVILAALLHAGLPPDTRGQTDMPADSPVQIQSEDLLKTDLMFIGAHPDDESSVTATFAREVIDKGARASLVFATRGEGGGNAIGKQLGPALGALREAELRRAAAHYGVDLVYFLDKTDFFYTMSSQAAFDVWDHDDSLGRLVRLVRLLRPDVIVTMWPGPGNHGMHQAAARLATEAFSAAADPLAFPEHLTVEYLEVWQPAKLYYTSRSTGAHGISSAAISPRRFMSYAEIKGQALRNYRSQAFDRRNTIRRSGMEWFLLARSTVPLDQGEVGLRDGIGRTPEPGIYVAPEAQSSPDQIRIVPREDVARFRTWAQNHDVGWTAGLLPAARTMAAGTTDTVLVEISNTAGKISNGRLNLSLPESWHADDVVKRYTVPANSTALLPFLVSVPASISTGSHPLKAESVIYGETVSAVGEIVVVPHMTIERRSKAIVIDGQTDEWDNLKEHTISSSDIWSGELPGGDGDCSARLQVAYDDSHLYFALRVTDDAVVTNIPPDDVKAPWRSDAVEICIDPSGTAGESTLQVFKLGVFPGTTTSQEARGVRDADAMPGLMEVTASGARVASFISSSGYTIEAAISWGDLPGEGIPGIDTPMGLNVIVYDGDDHTAGPGANIGKARIGWSGLPNSQVLPYHYGRAVLK